jgi:soluble lytic murein transglycosylase-like protein
MGDKPEAANNNAGIKNRPLKQKSKPRKGSVPPGSVTVTYIPGQKPAKKGEANDFAKLSNQYVNFLLFRNYSLEKNPGLVSYLKPYAAELQMLAENLGIKGKENLQRVTDILEICSDRIQDENHDFVILALAVMMGESNWYEAAVSRVGAHGLMQVMPRTAVEILLRMDDYVLFSIGLHPWDKLHQKLNLIKQFQAQSRRIKPGEEERASQIKTHLNGAINETEKMLIARNLLINPTFNISLGVFYLSSLIERFKPIKSKTVDEITLVKAIASYNAGPRADMLQYINYALKRSNGKIDHIFFKYLPKKAFSQTWAYIRKVADYYHLIKNNPSEVFKFVKKA